MFSLDLISATKSKGPLREAYYAKYASWWNFHRALPEESPVIVYTMKKVATTTVESVKDLGHNVYKQHCLNEVKNGRLSKDLNQASRPGQQWLVDGAHFQGCLDKRLGATRKHYADRRCKIITLVRDSIAVIQSDIFAQLFGFHPEFTKRSGLHDLDHLRSSISCLMAEKSQGGDEALIRFLRDLIRFSLDWFEGEIDHTFGVNVLKAEFPPAVGYAHYERSHIGVVLIHAENLQRSGPRKLAEFLGAKQIASFMLVNITSWRRKGGLYDQMRKNLRLPERYLEQIYENSYARKFYTMSEPKSVKGKCSVYSSQ